MKLKKVLIWTLTILVVLLGIFTTIENATSGAEISKLEADESVLREEERKLGDELVKSQSLTNLAAQAPQIGFTKPLNILYISSQAEEVAKLP